MKRNNIYIRADGNEEIGLGHVSRSLALAEMLHLYFDIHFIIQAPDENLRAIILKHCSSVIVLYKSYDYKGEADLVHELIQDKEAVIVLDGYNFTTGYQQTLKQKGHKIVCIDDIPRHHFVADVIINHGGGIVEEDYSKEGYTRLYLGMTYALLRKPFREAALNSRPSTIRENNLLICLGGADPNSNIFGILDELQKWDLLEDIYIVIGNNFKDEERLIKYLSNYIHSYKLLKNISANEMVDIMQKCSSAILPPSTMSYEYLSVGGLLIIKQIAENQKKIKDFLLERELAIDYDTIQVTNLLVNSDVSEFRKRQKALFDGKQEKRILAIFQELLLTCRPANINDCERVFAWANEPSTRLQSFSSDAIPYEDHVQWFEKKIQSSETLFLIVSLKDEPIGQIRFDKSFRDTTISYSLDKSFRGRGLGELLLKKGIECLQGQEREIGILIGYVKKGNVPSVKAFLNLGFLESTNDDHENALKFTLS